MTYAEHVRTGFLPKIIDEYVIMTAHADKIKIYLTTEEGHYDYDTQHFGGRMNQIIAVYREFLSKA